MSRRVSANGYGITSGQRAPVPPNSDPRHKIPLVPMPIQLASATDDRMSSPQSQARFDSLRTPANSAASGASLEEVSRAIGSSLEPAEGTGPSLTSSTEFE